MFLMAMEIKLWISENADSKSAFYEDRLQFLVFKFNMVLVDYMRNILFHERRENF